MGGTDLVFLHFNHIPRCDASVDKHFDGYSTLQYMSSGAIDLSYDGKSFELKGEWFWPAYPGPWIRFNASSPRSCWNHRYVAFRGPLANRWHAEGLFPRLPQPAPRSGVYAKRFDELLSHLGRSGHWETLRAINQLEQLLIDLAEARSQTEQRQLWLTGVMEQLGACKVLDYTSLARTAGMALSTLRRRFHRSTGTSLHAYALQCRVAQARSLLGDTDQPIKSIAEHLGYRDVYFFSRQFHQLTGVPPAAYRRSRQR